MKAPPLVDRYGRRVRTLRISLTEHCNFRCTYCMPPEGLGASPRASHLSLDQLERIVRTMGDMGVDRYRLTGGEPMLRPDIIEIVRRLSGIETVRELSMTTNGSLLAHKAAALRDAGLDRINISLDSLDRERFNEVTRSRLYDQVREGVEAAIAAGFPLKINVVVMAGMTEREILDFVTLAVERELEVRFLEFMPLCGSAWERERVLEIGEVRSVVARHFPLEALPRDGHPAQVFRVAGARVGFIAPLSEPFCEDCSRIRMSADGGVQPCLFDAGNYPLAPALSGGANEVEDSIRAAVWAKSAGSQFNDAPLGSDTEVEYSIDGPMIRHIGG
jgi:cyclic pyranopterin phosphate synthase